jgi:hypothetical protein
MFIANLSIKNIKSYTVTASTDSLRSLLTVTSSITAYDAAGTNAWVNVTGTEYFRILSTVTGASAFGVTDTYLRTTGSGTSFNATLTVAMPSSTNIVASGTYLIGFAVRPGQGNQTVVAYPMIGYSYLGTYSNVGSARYVTPSTVTTASAYNVYFIRKAPTDSLSARGFIAYGDNKVGSRGYLGFATGAPMPAAYATTVVNAGSTAASATTPWTTYTSNIPIFQAIGTTVKSW